MGKGVFEAFLLDIADFADTFGFSCGTALFWEKGFGVGLSTQRTCLPGTCIIVDP